MARRRALPDEISIYTAATLQEQLHGWLRRARRGVMRVDGSAVCDVDAAGVQLLVAFQRGLDARGVSLEILAPAECLCEAAATLGLAQTLGLVQAPVTEARA